jgi:hypothetical protein
MLIKIWCSTMQNKFLFTFCKSFIIGKQNRRLTKCKVNTRCWGCYCWFSDHTCFSYGDTKLAQHIAKNVYLHFASCLLTSLSFTIQIYAGPIIRRVAKKNNRALFFLIEAGVNKLGKACNLIVA